MRPATVWLPPISAVSWSMNRIDGRASDELRLVAFKLGIAPYAGGLVLVTMGNTRVICGSCCFLHSAPIVGGCHSFGRFSPPMTLLLRLKSFSQFVNECGSSDRERHYIVLQVDPLAFGGSCNTRSRWARCLLPRLGSSPWCLYRRFNSGFIVDLRAGTCDPRQALDEPVNQR